MSAGGIVIFVTPSIHRFGSFRGLSAIVEQALLASDPIKDAGMAKDYKRSRNYAASS